MADLSMKYRSVGNLSIGHTYLRNGSILISGGVPVKGHKLHQVTWSRSNPIEFLGRSIAGRIPDIGGPFETKRLEVVTDPQGVSLLDLNYSLNPQWELSGPMVAHTDVSQALRENFSGKTGSAASTWLNARTPSLLPAFELDELGATAISRVAPTSPLVDGASNVAELLREGLPSIPGTQRNPGSEYLNYQFGIAPTIGFVQDAIKAAKNADEVLKQLHRDSGRLVRRRYEFDTEIDTVKTVTTGTYPIMADGQVPSIYVAQRGTMTKITRTKRTAWFSGAFTYHFPKSGLSEKLYEWDRLYGAVPGVDTLYNLVPWSWLVDYFSNTGDVMSNLNAFSMDGLVMPFGYMMVTQQVTDEYTWIGELRKNNAWVRHVISDKVVRETKQRRPATPWGFGVSADLTGRQIAILAALGISRV